jgi:XapX domain-containing protein
VTGILQALAAGALVGTFFGLLHIAAPAPATWAGVAGIVGIVAAWRLIGMWVA